MKPNELLFNQNINYIEVIKKVDYKTVFGNETIYFKPVTCDKDLYYCCFEYQLHKEQQEMVNPPYVSIARAYTNPFSYYPFIICDKEDNNIGFICLCKWIGKGDSFSFSLLIDKRYQKRGYGIASIKLAIDILKAVNKNTPIKIAVEQSNKKAQDLYKSMGFVKLDELDGNDLVFVYMPE